MGTKGEVKGGGTEKTEKRERDRKREIAISTRPSVGVYSGTNLHASGRASEGGRTLPTAHRGDQARKPASCTSSVGQQPTDGTLTPAYTSI